MLCDENLAKLVGMFEMYYSRLSGVAHCIVPQLLPIEPDPSIIQSPSMELLASIMAPNQPLALGGNQIPSIVQIIVPAHQLHNVIGVEKSGNATFDNGEIAVSSTTMTSTTTMNSILITTSESIANDVLNETATTPFFLSTTEEPLQTLNLEPSQQSMTTPDPELDRDDDIDDIQLNEDDDYQENEEKIKKQRDKSDFRYVESFESEPKTVLQNFEPDLSDNETELKNIINDNFQQIPSVLPVPKALSSLKDPDTQDEEPPELPEDQNKSSDPII